MADSAATWRAPGESGIDGEPIGRHHWLNGRRGQADDHERGLPVRTRTCRQIDADYGYVTVLLAMSAYAQRSYVALRDQRERRLTSSTSLPSDFNRIRIREERGFNRRHSPSV